MPPYLALIFCIIFIIVLFSIELKKGSEVSAALWVPFIWYGIAASRSITQWIYPTITAQPDVYLSGSPIDRGIDIILILLGVIILYKRKVDWPKIRKYNVWILLLFIYVGHSVFWSDYSMVSFKRWVRTAGTLLMALVVLTEPKPLDAISTILRRCFYLHIPLSIICIKYFRNIGVVYDYSGEAEMWVGVATHKNVLGQVVMISGVYFFWRIIRSLGSEKKSNWNRMEKFINVSFFIMGLWILNGSQTASSKTSIFTFLFGVVLFLLFHFIGKNPQNFNRKLILSVIAIASVLWICNFSVSTFSDRSLLAMTVKSSGRDMTLTGRTGLWKDILDIAFDKPIIGVGYGSFWIGDLFDLWRKHTWQPQQAHNGYIDIFIELGLVGLILLIGATVTALRYIRRNLENDYEYGAFRMIFLFMILIHNITESSLVRGKHNLWFIFLLVVLNIPEASLDRCPGEKVEPVTDDRALVGTL